MNKTIQTLPDGEGFSPDVGNGVVKNNIIAWEKGGITDLNNTGLIVRWMPKGAFLLNFNKGKT